jgi:hypothetical protein
VCFLTWLLQFPNTWWSSPWIRVVFIHPSGSTEDKSYLPFFFLEPFHSRYVPVPLFFFCRISSLDQIQYFHVTFPNSSYIGNCCGTRFATNWENLTQNKITEFMPSSKWFNHSCQTLKIIWAAWFPSGRKEPRDLVLGFDHVHRKPKTLLKKCYQGFCPYPSSDLLVEEAWWCSQYIPGTSHKGSGPKGLKISLEL